MNEYDIAVPRLHNRNKKKLPASDTILMAVNGKDNFVRIGNDTNCKDKSTLSKAEKKSSGYYASSTMLNKISGFNSVILYKRNYFRRIKLNNIKKSRELFKRERINMMFRFIFYICSNVINIVNILNYIAQTYADKSTDPEMVEYSHNLAVLELSCSLYFLIEYMILFYRFKDSLAKHLISWDSLIDLITIVPSIATYFITNPKLKSIFRIFRVFRILRIYKSLKKLQYDTSMESNGIGLNSIVSINPIKLQFIMIVLIFFCLFFICAGLVIGFQEFFDKPFNKPNLTFVDAIYFIIITASTTGYGDIFPTHLVTRLLIISLIFSIVMITSYQVSKLIGLLKIWGFLVYYHQKNHVILIMDKTINLYLLLRQIKKSNPEQCVIIISKDIHELESKEFPYNKVHLINSSSIDIEILDRANTKKALAIFIFASKLLIECEQPEKVNEFIILKINEYYGHVPILVQTLYSERSFSQRLTEEGIKHSFQQINFKDSFLKEFDMEPFEKNILKTKKIIPIFRIKTLLISKALFNPGYANFMQNLLFNDAEIPIYLDQYDMIMQVYFLGSENTLQIKPFPRFFHKCDFFEALRLIYSKSVQDFFIKLTPHDIMDIIRPVLLIGVVDIRSSNQDIRGHVKLYPRNFTIKPTTLGVFISYEGNGYLDKVLSQFPNIPQHEKENEIFEDRWKARRRIAFCESPPTNQQNEVKKKKKSNAIINLPMSSKQIERKEVDKAMAQLNPTLDQENINPPEEMKKIESQEDNIVSELNRLFGSKPTIKRLSEENLTVASKSFELNAASLKSSVPKCNDEYILTLNKYQTIETQESQGRRSLKHVNPEKKRFLSISPMISNIIPIKNSLGLRTTGEQPDEERKQMFSFSDDKKSNDNDSDNDNDNDQAYSKSGSVDCSNSSKITKNFHDKQFFMQKKSLIISGKEDFTNESTRLNMILLQSYDDKDLVCLRRDLLHASEKRYGSDDIFEDENEYFIETRIYDCEKNNVAQMLSSHILILGYQDGLFKLIKLLKYHFPYKDICIMTSSNEFDDKIIKILKQYKNLYYLKGEAENPNHLLNAGIQKAFYVIFLVEAISGLKEDMKKLLAFKSIDYFFNVNMILELWSNQSAKLIGYLPMDQDAKVINNEFIHGLFMAGRVIYLDHLDRIIGMAYESEYKVDAWTELLELGFKPTSSSLGFKTLNGNRSRDGYPVTITVDIPEGYVGKEFFILFTDLICLRIPALILGIYVEHPIACMKLKSEGRVNKFTRGFSSDVKILTSHKRQLVNIKAMDKFEQGYMNNLKALREISYNNKVVLDYVDVRHPYLPVFITNPPPWFIISPNSKIMVMYHYSPKNKGIIDFQRQLFRTKNREKLVGSTVERNKKLQMNRRQEMFYFYFNLLKERMQKHYTEGFKDFDKN